MKNKKTKLTAIFGLVLFLGLTLSAGAQERQQNVDFNRRILGDRVLTLNFGGTLPLFWQNNSGETEPLNLSMSMLFGIDFATHLTNEIRLGGSFKGNLFWGPNSDILFSIPMAFTATYEFKFYPFSVPLTLSPGIILLTYQDILETNFVLQAGTGFYWTADRQWSYGINVNYNWIPQVYGDSRADQSGFANFLEVSFGIRHFFY